MPYIRKGFRAKMDETESEYQRLLDARAPEEEDLTKRDRRQLKQPVTCVRPDNFFRWHLNRHTVFEDETDPKRIKNGIYLRRVGVTAAGRLTEAQIAVEEDRLGVRLPEPWRDVYRHFDGGWTDELYWGDMSDPRMYDPMPIPQYGHEYLALEDVAPLRELMPKEMEGYDWTRLDPRLITIACAEPQAVILDYRDGVDPRVCCAFFSRYDDDPVESWERHEFTYWWPNMRVFFRGLYLQDRNI